MYYLALSNISSVAKKYAIKKGQTINKEAYDKLPDRHKKHFKVFSTPADTTPLGLNQIIGDTPEEKVKHEALAKEDEGKPPAVGQRIEEKSGTKGKEKK